MQKIIGNHLDTMEMELEAFVDAHGLECVLNRLASVCREKAEHVETNWQDARLARIWNSAANKITAASNSGSVRSVSPYDGML
jgi:hypothetical protein